MRPIFLTIAVAAVILPSAGRCEMTFFEGSTSPSGKLAIGYDPARREDDFCLASFPDLKPIGNYVVTDHVIPGHGFSRLVWNAKAHRVAFISEGISVSTTAAFEYSPKGLKELPMPYLGRLPDRWYPRTLVTQCHVAADRWLSRDRLRLFVFGQMLFGDPTQTADYYLNAIIKFGKDGRGRVESVIDGPMELVR